jgi:soluble lytic murein transglycosylase-like protein
LEERAPETRSLAERAAAALRTPHALGFYMLLLTTVPAYLATRSNAPLSPQQVARMAVGSDDSAEAAMDEFSAVEIEAHIRQVAVRYRIAPLLVAAIVEAESEFNPRAVSRRGARGLMQLMPHTASSLQVRDTFDPYKNIEGGVRHLRRLMNRYNGNLPLVLAAYNAGEQAVQVYGGVPPYPETRRYVNRILRRIGLPSTSRAGTGAARRTPEARAVTVANHARMDESVRQALRLRALAEIDRSPAAAPADPQQSADERPSTVAPRTNRFGPEGP